MFVTIINDCRDPNAMGRQATRVAALLNWPVNTVGVQNDLEAAGTLVDVLDAAEGREGYVLVNVAPRNGKAGEKWKNGSPFGYVRYGDTRILSTVDGYTLTLFRDLVELNWCNIFDIPSVVLAGVQFGFISPQAAERISFSQFRSFDLLPRLAQLVAHEVPLSTKIYPLTDAPDPTDRVWYVDSFGNAKVALLPKHVVHGSGRVVSLIDVGEVVCYEHLSNVPNGETGLVVGSSGLEDQRLLELVVQGGSAAEKFDLIVGSVLT